MVEARKLLAPTRGGILFSLLSFDWIELMASGNDGANKVDISLTDGTKVTDEAATWAGTSYSLRGPESVKGVAGDCSGTTYLVYDAVGFHFEYQVAATFAEYAVKSGLFRQLGIGEQLQDGDVLSWSNHMAIYATFQNDKVNATTPRVSKKGQSWTQNNNMWTASKPGGPDYGPAELRWWRADPPKVFRYQKTK